VSSGDGNDHQAAAKVSKPLHAPQPAALHPEAFALMLYVSDDGRHVETIWNSRDGVTPFVVGIPGESDEGILDGRSMRHVLWGADVRAPMHVPNIGDRVVVDATEDMVRPGIEDSVDRLWAHPTFGLRDSFKTKADAIAKFMSEALKPGAPTLVAVDEPLQQHFLRRRQRTMAVMAHERAGMLLAQAAITLDEVERERLTQHAVRLNVMATNLIGGGFGHGPTQAQRDREPPI
jgi:hypothetical protein